MGRVTQTFDTAGLFSHILGLLEKTKWENLLYMPPARCCCLSYSLLHHSVTKKPMMYKGLMKEESERLEVEKAEEHHDERKKEVKGRKTNKPKKSKGKKRSRNRKKTKGRKSLNRKGTNSEKMKGNGKPKRKPSLRRDPKSTTFCPTEKATSLKLLYNQVYNFKKQLKRAQSQANIVKKKKAKKDNFAKDAAILTVVVGGNLTNPTCSAKGRSATNAASQGSTLSSCSSTIASSCQDITINSTLTGSCSDTMTTFEAKVTTCKTDDSCTCWTE